MILKKFEELTIAEIETLSQAHMRLLAEGFISVRHSFGTFLDVVVARGDYADTRTDEIVKQMQVDGEFEGE